MYGEILKIGDEILVYIPAENRANGYNPCADGTRGTIVGFGETLEGWANLWGKKPGVYTDYSYSTVRTEDGKQFDVSSSYVELPDEEETKRREKEVRENNNGVITAPSIWLRDLPETEFIEGDIVTSPTFRSRPNDFPNCRAAIYMVNYRNIGGFCSDNITPLPIYSVTSERWLDCGWSLMNNHEEETHFRLAERGLVWKYRHNEPLDFPDVETHARFLSRLGETVDVRNPASGNFAWTIEEATEAIYSGIGHSITVSNGLFGLTRRPFVVRFKDEVVGEAIRQLTMKGFPRGAAC
jgi:hypothetical protein